MDTKTLLNKLKAVLISRLLKFYFRRLVAYLIDYITTILIVSFVFLSLFAIIYILLPQLNFSVSDLDGFRMIIPFVIFFISILLGWDYFFTRDSNKGLFPSLGKKLMRLEVIDLKTNKPVSPRLSFNRNFLSTIFNAFFLIDLLGLAFGKHTQKISDFMLEVEVVEKSTKENQNR